MKEKSRPKKIDSAPRLLLVLVRHALGWFEQAQLATALGGTPSQISMWERGERPIPREVLARAAALAGIPRPLLPPVLRALRWFQRISQAGGRPGHDMAAVAAIDLFPPLLEAADLLRASRWFPAGDPEGPEELWARLARRTPAERLLIVEEGEEYQTRELHERVLAESAALAATEPHRAGELADLAARIAELAEGGGSAR